MKRMLLLLCALLAAHTLRGASAEEFLAQLDAELRDGERWRRQRQLVVDSLQRRLADSLVCDDGERFDLLAQLADRCCGYDYASASAWVARMSDLAASLGDRRKIHAARLSHARVLFSGGLFMSALETLDAIDERELSPEQLVVWCSLHASNYYGFASFIGQSEHAQNYMRQGNAFQERLTRLLPEQSVEHRIARAHLLIHRDRDYESAAALLRPLCEEADLYDREFAKYATTMAMLCGKEGEVEQQKRLLAQAAICDIRNAVRENTALMLLSQILYAQGSYDRAWAYARQAFEDASSYNARHRKVQLSDIMHMIETERFVHEQRAGKRLRNSFFATTILSVFSLILLCVVLVQLRSANRSKVIIEQTNRKLQQLNLELREANQIKDTYLIDFLVICMDYIDKIDGLLSSARKRVKTQAWDELTEVLDPMIPHKERQTLAKTFDSIFFSLFPTFVDEVNDLLCDDGKIRLKKKELLNNELRIYALMRLGIRDSVHIAKFLDCTVNTIYTYRTNVKARALDRNSFESDVMKIGIRMKENDTQPEKLL